MSRDEEPIYLRLCTHTLRYCTRFQVGAAERRARAGNERSSEVAREGEKLLSVSCEVIRIIASGWVSLSLGQDPATAVRERNVRCNSAQEKHFAAKAQANTHTHLQSLSH